jgi:hypothetical protein
MPIKRKWSTEDLVRELPLATSRVDLARRLGLRGNSHTHSVLRTALELGLDVSHLGEIRTEYGKRRNMKVDDATLRRLVAESYSVKEVMQKAGYAPAGGSHAALSRRIKQLKIDTSHFAWRPNRSGSRRKTAAEILIVLPPGSFRGRPEQLRRALLEVGRSYKCAECGLPPVWRGKPLRLQVEHINGDRLDCRAENLCFMCPNCHTQTETYARYNGM